MNSPSSGKGRDSGRAGEFPAAHPPPFARVELCVGSIRSRGLPARKIRSRGLPMGGIRSAGYFLGRH